MANTTGLLAFTKPPFHVSEKGWGEFEIIVECFTTEKTKLAPIIHDLNFLKERYENEHVVHFKNPSQALQEKLRETGPLPNDEDAKKKKSGLSSGSAGKRQKFDYEKIAEALEKLEEEDLLRVIQLINENKGPDTYIRSDVDGKLFYTLPLTLFACLFPPQRFLLASTKPFGAWPTRDRVLKPFPPAFPKIACSCGNANSE